MSEYRLKIAVFEATVQFVPKFHVQGDVPILRVGELDEFSFHMV